MTILCAIFHFSFEPSRLIILAVLFIFLPFVQNVLKHMKQ
jgi:hypothetical protein